MRVSWPVLVHFLYRHDPPPAHRTHIIQFVGRCIEGCMIGPHSNGISSGRENRASNLEAIELALRREAAACSEPSSGTSDDDEGA